ncbi:MAG: purine-nucleoside phosphorylase [Armatimonadetes bacterium]|nr:purine-nucleoside phosphorylase [Armatimonadota bacterium]
MSEHPVDAAVAYIRGKTGGRSPKVAIVCGSGLGGVADAVEDPLPIPYTDIPGFPVPTVAGHAGKLILGDVGGKSVAVMMGRVHIYEGTGMDRLKTMIRSMKELGVNVLVLTNAAGSMMPEVGAGELVMLTDHINFTGTSPLFGPNDDRFGPRFVDLTEAWDVKLREAARHAASEENITLHQGVFGGWMGPAFETPAEIRMMRTLGCDTVGMSMIAENLIARHCDLRVLGISAITNLACGLSDVKLSHEHTLAMAKKGDGNLTRLIARIVRNLEG